MQGESVTSLMLSVGQNPVRLMESRASFYHFSISYKRNSTTTRGHQEFNMAISLRPPSGLFTPAPEQCTSS